MNSLAKWRPAGRRMCMALLAFLALVATSVPAAEPKSRIRHAEPVAFPAFALPRSAKLQADATPATVAFDAFGRHFELELESNDRILRKLSASRRAELPPHDMYRGRIAGLPGSWLRLTSLPDGLYGTIWDGQELYSIVPAHAAAEFMGGATPPDSDQPLIYRASDVELLVGPGFCTVLDPAGRAGGRTTGLDQYRTLLRELPRQAATSAAVATLELEVAMLGDFEFYSIEPDSTGALLNRLNIVDGIFSQQVGVAIVASELKVFDSAADPFTTTDAETLLEQVGSYRAATPVTRSAGLAHLVTGRDLAGDTVGIAYIAGICENEIGVSLSERWFDTFTSALIAAHEFGHNFGAPHDGEVGPCRNAPFGFLMWPELTGASQFSQCSVDQMQPVIAASSCLRARQYVDVSLELDPATYSMHTRVPETVVFDVVNDGTATALGASASVRLASGLLPTSIDAEGGTCITGFEEFACQFDPIPAGGRRRVQFELTATEPGSITGQVSVTADADADQENNHGFLRFEIQPATDVSIAAQAPQDVTVLSGDEFQVSYLVSSAGTQPSQQVSVRTLGFGYVVLAATPQSGTCTFGGGTATCNLGSLPSGSSRRVTLRLRADRAGDHTMRHDLSASPDDMNFNNIAVHSLRVNPLVDLVVQADTDSLQIRTGEPITRRFTVRSLGPREARNASFSVNWPDHLAVTAVAAQDATCTLEPSATSYRCAFAAAIASGGSRIVDVTFRAIGVGTGVLRGSVFAPDNQHIDGPLSTSAEIRIDAREGADLRFDRPFDRFGYDNKPIDIGFQVLSVGLSAVQNASVTLSLPPGVEALSATPSVGTCSLESSSVRCELGAISPDTAAQVWFSILVDRPGVFSISAGVGATNDDDASNNQASMSVEVAPNVDVRALAPPQLGTVIRGRKIAYPVTIMSASQPVENVRARISGWNFDIDVISISQGSCTRVGDAFECTIGGLSANAQVQLGLELTGLEPGSAQVAVEAIVDADVDWSNDIAGELLLVLPGGNVRVDASPGMGRPRASEPFDSPEIGVLALLPTEAVQLRVTVPAGLVIEGVSQSQASCSIAADSVNCDFGSLQSSERRSTVVRLRATQAGNYSLIVSASALDDVDMADNFADVTVVVDPAAPPAAPDPPSSGGGGGGSLDWTSLALGMAALALRRRRRPPTSAGHSGQVHSGRCPDGPSPC